MSKYSLHCCLVHHKVKLLLKLEVQNVHLEPLHLWACLAVALNHLFNNSLRILAIFSATRVTGKTTHVDVDKVAPPGIVKGLAERAVSAAQNEDAGILANINVLGEAVKELEKVVGLEEPVKVVAYTLAAVSDRTQDSRRTQYTAAPCPSAVPQLLQCTHQYSRVP